MKMQLGAAMMAALLLSACAQPTPPADQAQIAGSATPNKKKCSDQTGSRLAPCGEGSTGDYVSGSSGDFWRQASIGKSPH